MDIRGVLYAGAVLEISLSSFQTACLSWTFAVCVQWDLRAEFPVMLQQKFLQRSPIFLRGDQKKKSSLHFLTLKSKQKPVTPLFSPLCMPRET